VLQSTRLGGVGVGVDFFGVGGLLFISGWGGGSGAGVGVRAEAVLAKNDREKGWRGEEGGVELKGKQETTLGFGKKETGAHLKWRG